jgi:tRNA pseudouridine55 synthase
LGAGAAGARIAMDGIINLDKPAGISSARAVAAAKRLLPRGTKVGHAGTLDPFATGVLLLLVGKATRSCERLMDEPKQYEATVRFGAATATDDLESPEILTADVKPVPLSQVQRVVRTLEGEILQRPPAYSAMKVAGRRAYDLARRGEVVQLEARPVRVYAIEILGYEWPLLRVRIDCGRGTYVRSLARDMGAALAVGGYLTQLRRTRVGPFEANDAVTMDRLVADGPAGVLHHIRPPL